MIAYFPLKKVRMKAWLSCRRTNHLDCAPYARVAWFLVIRVSCWLKKCMIYPIDVVLQRFVKNSKKIRFFLFPLSFPSSSSETCGFVFLKPSQDCTNLLKGPRDSKGSLHMPNATVTPTKRWLPHVLLENQQNLSMKVFVRFLTRQNFDPHYIRF